MNNQWGVIAWIVLSLCIGAPSSNALPIGGRVVDYKARPVVAAEVALCEKVHDYSSDRDFARLRDEIVKTDREGRFVFSADVTPSYRVCIIARKQGLALGWDILTHADDNIIVLEKPSVLAGTVVDAAGTPVSGATVRAAPKSSHLQRLEQWPVLGPEAWLTVRTDGQGAFRFEQFSADVSADFVAEASGESLAYEYTTNRMTICGYQAGSTDIRLTVPNGVPVHGQVVEAEGGKPVAGAGVVIHPERFHEEQGYSYLPHRTVSGPDGRFTFRKVPAGKHYIAVTTAFETGLVDRRVRFEIGADEDSREVRAMLHAGGVVEIVAREAKTDAPLADLSLRCWQAGETERSNFHKAARTDADGRLKIHAPPGQCRFLGHLDGYCPWDYEGEALVVAGRTTQARVVLERYPRVAGLALDEEDRPVSGAIVNYYVAGTDEAVTDGAGRFETPFYLDDPLDVWLVRHVPRNLAAVVEGKPAAAPVRIRLKPALRVSGRVTDPNGSGIAAARVELCLSTHNALIPVGHETTTDSQGYFHIDAVVPERDGFVHRISVHASGYGRARNRITIPGEPGTSATLDPIVLQPANRSISGVLVDADGVPGARLVIYAHGKGQPSRTMATDRQGRFVLGRICEGPIRIQANSPGGSTTVEVQAGQNDVRIVVPGRLAVPQSLLGKPLPPLKTVVPSVSAEAAEARPLLLCFFDMNQRPSRRCIRQLVQKAHQLKDKGISVVAIQAAPSEAQALAEWAEDQKVPFPVTATERSTTRLRLDWGVQSLPWLILTDAHRAVQAEGFAPSELETRIKGQP
ncbi:MAG: carboxypeptidase regulatory-like domain-containing protein [Sedimentisphaerales bacterium]|nr:carboxypeptidase regulatory-like domain-containing protein [Sedimentisphaerales bacterium]